MEKSSLMSRSGAPIVGALHLATPTVGCPSFEAIPTERKRKGIGDRNTARRRVARVGE